MDPPPPRGSVGDPGEMFALCPKCDALKLKPLMCPVPSPGELDFYKMCCNKGVVNVQEECPSPLAQYIFNLWETNEYEGRVFRKFARKINNAFSLASFGVDEELSDRHSTSTYKVRGKCYVRVGSLLPRESKTPQFAQIYCYDAQDDKDRVEVHLGHVHLDRGLSVQQRQTLKICFLI